MSKLCLWKCSCCSVPACFFPVCPVFQIPLQLITSFSPMSFLIVTHSHFIYPLLLHLSLNPGEPSLLFSPNPRHNESASSHSPLTLGHSSSPQTSRTSLSRRLFSPRHSDSRGEALDGELVPTTQQTAGELRAGSNS